MKIVLCAALFSLLVFGCEKAQQCENGCLTFVGKVFDPNNDKPVVSARVLLVHHGAGMGTWPETLGEAATDNQGYFRFDIPSGDYLYDNGYYTISAEKDGYLSNNIDGRIVFYNIDDSDKGKPIQSDIALLPAAEINIVIDATMVYPVSVELKYKYSNATYTTYLENIGLSYVTRTFTTAGDQYTQVMCSYGSNTLSDSIYIEAGKSGTYKFTLN